MCCLVTLIMSSPDYSLDSKVKYVAAQVAIVIDSETVAHIIYVMDSKGFSK